MSVYIQKEENRAIEIDYQNYFLGQYISYAFNKPKDYPSKPFLAKEPQVMSVEEMERMARKNTILAKGIIK